MTRMSTREPARPAAPNDMSPSSLPAPVATAITARFTFAGVEQIHGVTFDGEHVWFAASPDNDLHCVDPATGKLLRKLGRRDCAAGLAFDGQHLWQICGEQIHRIDRATGRTLRAIPAPPGGGHSGLAFAAGHLWVGSFRGRSITKVDPADGRVVAEIASDRLVTGVTFCAGELWHGTWPEAGSAAEPGELRQVDAASGAVRRRLHLPAGTHISGTESDGKDRIWFGNEDGAGHSLCAVDRRG